MSSSFYVGYVEDKESIANIMKKFQTLEKFKEKKKQDNPEGETNNLTEKDMEQLFTQTSGFNMNRVLNEDYYHSDYDEDLIDSDDELDQPTKKRRKGTKGSKGSRSGLNYTVVPSGPLPLSWGRRIKQYVPQEFIHTKTTWQPGQITNKVVEKTDDIPAESVVVKTDNVLSTNLQKLAKEKKGGFEGIVISAPWKERLGFSFTNDKGIEPEDLLKLGLENTKVIKAGFIYIWTPKHLARRIVEVMKKMNFFYVENGMIVRQNTNNKLSQERKQHEGSVFTVTHELLLIFRKGFVKPSGKREWTKVEIRHQRTSDVAFGYYGKDSEYEYANDYVYNLVETMVPLGRFNPNKTDDETKTGKESAKQQGRLLHLWSSKKYQRSGWVHVSQK